MSDKIAKIATENRHYVRKTKKRKPDVPFLKLELKNGAIMVPFFNLRVANN